MGYYDTNHEFLNPTGKSSDKITFFIDPLNGQIYSHKDVEVYFRRIGLTSANAHFKKLDNKQIIAFLLTELSKCFDNDRNRYKMEEVLNLAKLVKE